MSPLRASLLLATMIGGYGCVKSEPVPVAPKPATAPADEPASKSSPQPTDRGIPEEKNGSGANDNGSVPVVLQEKAFAPYVDNTKALRYSLRYSARTEDGDINFVNGTAKLTFSKLPIGKAGDLTLLVTEGGVLKLKGEAKNLTLTVNNNPVDLKLEPVAPDTTELTLEVTLGGGTTGGTGGGGGSGGPSFAKDARPILDRYCSECHHTGGRSPDLTNYTEAARTAARSVAKIADGTMPPTPRDKVAAADSQVISAWQSGGANP